MPLLSEIYPQVDPPTPFETRGLRQISAYNVSTVRDSEEGQLRRIGSRPWAFRRAIDGVRSLSVSSPKDDPKKRFFVLKIKFN